MSAEGLRLSGRPPGVVATAWLARLDRVDRAVRDRVLRGRTLARGGRVLELDVAPGGVFAEIEDGATHRPSLRIDTWDDAQWAVAVSILTERLSVLADLLEGIFPADLAQTFASRGHPLLPRPEELDGNCDCGDWAMPCAHGAALEYLLAEVLDADPFVLFTLRGRPREQLWVELRRAWGDGGNAPTRASLSDPLPLPEGGWTELSAPLPPMTFRFGGRAELPGTAELGPLEGDDGLDRVLQPLYEAGSSWAVELALAAPSGGGPRRRRAQAEPPPPEEDGSERLVDALAEAEEGATAAELGRSVGWTEARVRAELEQLAALGLVARTGRGKRERWWLG